MQVFQLEHFTAASHKPFAPARLHSLKIPQMQLLWQQMWQHVVSMLMESHLLYTLMFHKITRITYTAQVVQPVLVNQVQS
jgi:hypothetical protein